jgi:hypothetical protein
MLTRRLQVLIDDERLERLRRESKRVGAPIGELVRRALDREYPPQPLSRAEAGRRLLEREPPEDPEPDWEETKEAMLAELAARIERPGG